MLEHIRKEISYIAHDYYRFELTVTIDGKEYTETESCTDGEVSRLAPLEGQLHRLILDVDIEFITEFVNDVENVKTSDDFEDAQKTWDALVRVQELIDKISNDSDTNKFDRLYRILVKAHDTIFSNGGDICEEYTAKPDRKKCPLYKDGKCMLNSTLTALNSLRDACIAKR